jgi:hypothetical protein
LPKYRELDSAPALTLIKPLVHLILMSNENNGLDQSAGLLAFEPETAGATSGAEREPPSDPYEIPEFPSEPPASTASAEAAWMDVPLIRVLQTSQAYEEPLVSEHATPRTGVMNTSSLKGRHPALMVMAASAFFAAAGAAHWFWQFSSARPGQHWAAPTLDTSAASVEPKPMIASPPDRSEPEPEASRSPLRIQSEQRSEALAALPDSNSVPRLRGRGGIASSSRAAGSSGDTRRGRPAEVTAASVPALPSQQAVPRFAPNPRAVDPATPHLLEARSLAMVASASPEVSVSAAAEDADGDALRFNWSAPAGSFADASQRETLFTCPEIPGEIPLTVTVDDGRGGVASDTIVVACVAASGR